MIIETCSFIVDGGIAGSLTMVYKFFHLGHLFYNNQLTHLEMFFLVKLPNYYT